LKNEYQTKENEIKTHKSKLKDLQLNIDALKTEYEEAKNDLADIKV
jgi:hypothetical protein